METLPSINNGISEMTIGVANVNEITDDDKRNKTFKYYYNGATLGNNPALDQYALKNTNSDDVIG